MTNAELFSLEAEQPESKDFKKVLKGYTRYWYLLVLGGLLGLGGASLFLRYYTVSQYKVYSTMLIKDDRTGQGISNVDALNDLSTFKSIRSIDNEIEILKSRSLMQRVVEELNLTTSFYIAGKVKNSEIYGSAVPIKILIGSKNPAIIGKSFIIHLKPGNSFGLEEQEGKIIPYSFGQQITRPYGAFTVITSLNKELPESNISVRFQDIQQVANHYNQAVTIQPINKNSSVLSISLTDPIAEKAKAVINKLMEVYSKEAVEDRNLMVANTLKFLDERLKYLTVELSDVERDVEKYKSTNGLTDISTQATDYTAQASAYNKQLSEWAIQIGVLESIERYLRSTNGQYSTVPSTLGIKDETLLNLIGNFNTLQVERERMLRTIQPGSVLIVNINEQLASLRKNILENLRNIKVGLQITSNKLQTSSGQFQSKIRKVPAMERELQNISRPQEIKHNLYAYLLQKREETALALAATTSIARVIDPAMGGDYPISPNPQAIYLMALLLGLGLPIAAIYGIGLLDSKVQWQQDVFNVTSAPIIGEIVHSAKRSKVVVTQGSRSPIAEMFRLVRANLNFRTTSKKNVVLLVTSSISGEGKTFFSINLGASLALTDKRVVLIDLDLRNPNIERDLEMPVGLGITDYLASDTVTMNDIIRSAHNVPDLAVISAGPLPLNPAELLMSAKFVHLIQELKEHFDYIIFDTPPIGQVADAFALNNMVDYSIYLVRYNYTPKSALTNIKNIAKNKMLTNVMLVLNDASEQHVDNYGYAYVSDVANG